MKTIGELRHPKPEKNRSQKRDQPEALILAMTA